MTATSNPHQPHTKEGLRENMSKKSDFGLIGLAVMGQNLVLNVESRGFQVSVYNRTEATTEAFIAANPGKKLVGAKTLEEFVQSLAKPRKIQIMVKAGAPVDQAWMATGAETAAEAAGVIRQT